MGDKTTHGVMGFFGGFLTGVWVMASFLGMWGNRASLVLGVVGVALGVGAVTDLSLWRRWGSGMVAGLRRSRGV